MPARRWLTGGGKKHARSSEGTAAPGARPRAVSMLLGAPCSAPWPVDFGTVIYDLEAIHDAERGIYASKGLFECEHSEHIVWKRRSQVIQFAAVDLRTGERFRVSCRPKFEWDEVRSPAAREFAEDHGHDLIVKDMRLPHFEDRWKDEIMPFLKRAAGKSGRLAMIAHNGDKFDHYVLGKELCDLKLSSSGQLSLHCFDPVRTLKGLHGEDYGTGGQLRLETLHSRHVPADRVGARTGQHQAIDDCLMLREVLAHWQHLAEALAAEISGAFDAHATEVVSLFERPREPPAPSARPAAADAGSSGADSRTPSPAARAEAGAAPLARTSLRSIGTAVAGFTSAGGDTPSPRALARAAQWGATATPPAGAPARTSLRSIGSAVRPFVARQRAAGEAGGGPPAEAALLMRELQGGLDQACRTGTCCREVLGGQAQRVLGAATALVATVGGSTLAQGLARLRDDGQRVPPHLVRAWRELDAASALIRHPGAAERIVEVANSWLMQAVPVKFADEPHDAASDEAFASTGSVGAVATTDINAESDMCDSDPEDELQKRVNDKKGDKAQMVQDMKKMKAGFGYKSEQDMDDRLLKLEVATTDINAESDMCDSDPEDELQKGVNDKKGEKTQMGQDVKKMKAAFGYKSEQDMDDRLLKLEVKNVVVTNIVSEGPAGSSEGTADHSTDERCSLDSDPHAGVNAIDRTQLAGTICSTQCTATPSDTASQSRLLEYLTNHEAALLPGRSEGHAAGTQVSEIVQVAVQEAPSALTLRLQSGHKCRSQRLVANKSNGSNNSTWRCEPCNFKNGGKYKYCWKCWGARPTAAAAGASSAAAGEASEDKCHDEQLAKVQHYRAKLAELRKLAEDPFLEESLQPQVAQLEDELAAEQAALETGVPRCFTECRVVRDRNSVAEQKNKCQQRIDALQEQRDALDEKLADERSKLGKFDTKLETLDKKIKELAVPAPGKGCAAALAFLEQAERCLDDGGSEKREQLAAAVAHAKEQKEQEEERAKHAERLQQKARAEQARAAKERAGSADNRKRSCPEGPTKEDLLEIPAGANEQDICKALVGVGVTPDQAGKVVAPLKLLVGELQAGHALAISKTQWVQQRGGFVRKGINQWDISPRESKGRLAVAWIDAYSKEGLVLGAAYLWNSEGLTQRNKRILAKWGATMNAIQRGWILGGDFNIGPEMLEQAEIVRKMNEVIVRDTQQGSCLKKDGTRSTRDYFIVSRGLVAPTLKAEVQEGHNTSPHLPVRIRVPVHQQSDYMVNVLCKRQHTQGQVDGYWSELGGAYEKHLNRCRSFEGYDWSKRQGHFEKANYKQKPRRPKPCTAALEQQQWVEAAEWLARRLRQLRLLANAWQQRRDSGALRRAQHIADGLLSHDIAMPLFAERAPWQTAETGNDTDEEDGLLESVDAPRDEAEGVQDRLAVRAPPAEGQQDPNTRNTIRWPLIVHTLRDWRVSDIDERAQNYRGFIAALLDLASRRYWKMVHRAAAAQWRQWVATHGERGAGSLHKWTNAPAPWQPQAAPAGSDSDQMHELTHPQKAADAALQGWENIWHDPPEPRAPWLRLPTEIEWAEAKPPPITPQQVIEACGRFKTRTGLGESGWHPGLWREGGVQGAARVASTLNALEAGSPWPQAQGTILFYLLAKASGGHRDLGLIPELARLWETIRMPCARGWEQSHRRGYDWAARGGSSERAAWEQAVFCEATVAQGLEYAVTYFDLVKCFEYVTHEKVWQAGARSGFNTVILKMVLRIYSMTWARGIAAGSRLAPLCLKMVIFGELDGVIANYPWASVCFFFDDLVVATRGARLFVQYWHTRLVQALVDMFGGLDMRVSKGAEGKTVSMASTTALQDGLARRVRPLGIRMVRHADHLGVATAAGRRRRISAFSKRASKYAARRDRIARIRRAGGPAQAIIRQGKVPSAMYGVQVMGMGSTMGRSSPLTLLAQGADPAIRANTEPLVNWAMAWQEVANQDGLHAQLQSAWKKWALRVGRARAPWQQMRGPAGAFIATVQRLGWETLAAHSITSARPGQLLRGAALLKRPPSKKWTLEHQTRVRSLWRGGTWPQRRLFHKGAAEGSTCKAYHKCEGTDRHRTFVCSARQEHRRIVGGHHICHRGAMTWPGGATEKQLAASESLRGRGLAADPALEYDRRNLPSSSTCDVEGAFDGLVHGDIYTDGSLLYGAYPALRRGSWSFVKLDSWHKMEHAMFGPLEGPQHDQSIYKSELTAVLQVLRGAVPPVRIFSDCQSVLDGFARGPEWAARADTTHKEVWQECWRLVQENGGVGRMLNDCMGVQFTFFSCCDRGVSI
ncbi:unnamed protein product [Prorocentrum cordatum]|uniref:RanBP2-type domain-containing protein n=1 Tax=Prorocentrum cordatum TaxID=2364126 RepID=A0ABN9XJK8_9DINO|nr:unnamed protein product [Polarella glacialis]